MSDASNAYRLGLMAPKVRAEYEDAVRMGIVKGDTYADQRVYQQARPVNTAVAGGLMSVARAIPGVSELMAGASGGAGSGWTAARDRQQALVDQFKSDHPIAAALSTGAGYAVQAVPAMASGGATGAPAVVDAIAPGLKALAGRIAKRTAMVTIPQATRNAVSGMATAGAVAAGQPGTLQQRLAAAVKAAPMGAALGVGLPAAVSSIKGVGQLAKAAATRTGAVASQAADGVVAMMSGRSPADMAKVMTPEAQAAGDHAALDYLTRQGVTPSDLRQAALAAGSKPITTAEAMGPAGISTATGIVRRTGTSPALADATMSQRVNGRRARISDDIANATGVVPQDARTHIESLVLAGQHAANPVYASVNAIPGPIMTPELAAISQRPVIKRATQSVADSIRNGGGDPMTHGIPIDPDTGLVGSSAPGLDQMEMQPTAATWVKIHQRMGSLVERDAFGRPIPDSSHPGNSDINTARRDLGGILAGDGVTSPGVLQGYKDALDQAGDYLGIKGAYENASGILLGKSKRADPVDFSRWFGGLKPIEQEAAKSSMANDLLTGMQNGTLRAGSFALPHVQLKLQTAFGPDATDALTSTMAQEHAMGAAEARMTPNLNSTTGNVVGQLADANDGGAAVAGAVGHALMGRGGKALSSLAKGAAPFISAAKEPFDQAARDSLGDMLFADPAHTAHLLEMHQAAALPAPTPTTLTARIVARQLAAETGAAYADPPT